VREQVPFVLAAELLSGDGKRRAGYACRQQVGMGERAAVHRGQVAPDDWPLRALVVAQRLAGIGVEFDQALMREPGLLQAQRLSAGSGADLHRAGLARGQVPPRSPVSARVAVIVG
jgi:hypothetical protein